MNGGQAAANWPQSLSKHTACKHVCECMCVKAGELQGQQPPAGASWRNCLFFITDHKEGHDSILW